MAEERRLAAIMFTDIVGYTALMGKDEDRAFQLLRKNRELQRPLIKKYRGKWLKEMGDGILASFHSSSDAVRCAGEIQHQAKKDEIPLRIGIHEGEVVFDQGDVLGDGVNMASRLQEMTDEGCIYISEAVYKNIKNKTGIRTELIGEKNFKNVDGSVRIFKVTCEREINDHRLPDKRPGSGIYYIIGALMLIFFALIFIWKYPSREPVISEDLEKSIAVLPFNNLSPDLENQYFCDGIMEGILSNLSRIKDLRVSSRTSTEKYREKTTDAISIARELNVSYLLEGSVFKSENKIRVTAQLISALDDSHLWSEQYDRDLEDIFSVMSDISKQVASEIQVIIAPEVKKIIETEPTRDLTAYDFYLRGREYFFREISNEENLRYAIQLHEKAIQIDSNFVLAWVELATCSRLIYWFYYDRSKDQLLKVEKYLNKARSLSPDLKEVRLEEAFYFVHCKYDYDKSINILEKLISEYPNDAQVNYRIAAVYARMGENEKSLEYYNRAILLNPQWGFFYNASFTLKHSREYSKAEIFLKKALDLNPSNPNIYISLLVLYAKTGQIQKAREFTIEFIHANERIVEEDDFKIILADIEIFERNYTKAIDVLGSLSNNLSDQVEFSTKNLHLGLVYRLVNDHDNSMKHFEMERRFLMDTLNHLPDDFRIYNSLGIVYAGLGMKKEALEAGKTALEMMNLTKDISLGFFTEISMVKILTMVGDHEQALEKLEYIMGKTGYITVEMLKMDPFWDPLRNMERFRNIFSNPEFQTR
jgi:adenylate cyclase